MGLQAPRSFAQKRTTRRVHPPIVPMPDTAPWPPAASGPLLSLPKQYQTRIDEGNVSKDKKGRLAVSRKAGRGTAGMSSTGGSERGGTAFGQLSPFGSVGAPAFALESMDASGAMSRSVLDPNAARDSAARARAQRATDEELLGPE